MSQFSIIKNQLSDEQRVFIWHKKIKQLRYANFDGFVFYYSKYQNICKMCEESEWWSAEKIEHTPPAVVKKWIEENHKDFEVNVKNLSKFLRLKKDDSYIEKADYLTIFWNENFQCILTMMMLELIPNFLSGIFRNGLRDHFEQIAVCWLSDDFPENLPDYLEKLVDLGIESYLDDFVDFFSENHGMVAIDEFLALLVRAYAQPFSSVELEANDQKDDGGIEADFSNDISP